MTKTTMEMIDTLFPTAETEGKKNEVPTTPVSIPKALTKNDSPVFISVYESPGPSSIPFAGHVSLTSSPDSSMYVEDELNFSFNSSEAVAPPVLRKVKPTGPTLAKKKRPAKRQDSLENDIPKIETEHTQRTETIEDDRATKGQDGIPTKINVSVAKQSSKENVTPQQEKSVDEEAVKSEGTVAVISEEKKGDKPAPKKKGKGFLSVAGRALNSREGGKTALFRGKIKAASEGDKRSAGRGSKVTPDHKESKKDEESSTRGRPPTPSKSVSSRAPTPNDASSNLSAAGRGATEEKNEKTYEEDSLFDEKPTPVEPATGRGKAVPCKQAMNELDELDNIIDSMPRIPNNAGRKRGSFLKSSGRATSSRSLPCSSLQNRDSVPYLVESDASKSSTETSENTPKINNSMSLSPLRSPQLVRDQLVRENSARSLRKIRLARSIKSWKSQSSPNLNISSNEEEKEELVKPVELKKSVANKSSSNTDLTDDSIKSEPVASGGIFSCKPLAAKCGGMHESTSSDPINLVGFFSCNDLSKCGTLARDKTLKTGIFNCRPTMEPIMEKCAAMRVTPQDDPTASEQTEASSIFDKLSVPATSAGKTVKEFMAAKCNAASEKLNESMQSEPSSIFENLPVGGRSPNRWSCTPEPVIVGPSCTTVETEENASSKASVGSDLLARIKEAPTTLENLRKKTMGHPQTESTAREGEQEASKDRAQCDPLDPATVLDVSFCGAASVEKQDDVSTPARSNINLSSSERSSPASSGGSKSEPQSTGSSNGKSELESTAPDDPDSSFCGVPADRYTPACLKMGAKGKASRDSLDADDGVRASCAVVPYLTNLMEQAEELDKLIFNPPPPAPTPVAEARKNVGVPKQAVSDEEDSLPPPPPPVKESFVFL